jgi:transcriptional regulator with XRE-family HTH domain
MREKHLQFLDHVKTLTNLSLSGIARKAEIAETTLTRFVSKENFESLSQQTLDKVAKIAGYENYEDFIFTNRIAGSPIKTNKIKISDAEKFEIYENVKRIFSKKLKNSPSPQLVSKITQLVVTSMELMNTSYVSDSLILYVIEKENLL